MSRNCANSLVSKTFANQFQGVASTAMDYRVKAAEADIINAGSDLHATYAAVATDIFRGRPALQARPMTSVPMNSPARPPMLP